MNRIGVSKSGLFLMELILVILLFAISAAICLQMFTYASLTAQNAENLSYATLAARSAAECVQATGGDLDQVAEYLSGTANGSGLQVGYDDQWQPVDDNPTYQLELTQQGTRAEIAVFALEDGQSIYSLTVGVVGGDTL